MALLFLRLVFASIDNLLDSSPLNVQKLETINDCYMMSSGVTEQCDDHATSLALFALDMRKELRKFRVRNRPKLRIRMCFGLHSGSVFTVDMN